MRALPANRWAWLFGLVQIVACGADTSDTGEPDPTVDSVDTSEPCEESTWWVDGDRDGYGDPAAPTTACIQAWGLVDNDLDCDDTNAGVKPGGPDSCGDGVDGNCDGRDVTCLTGEQLVLADVAHAFHGWSTWQNAGTAVAGGTDLNQDGHDDLVVSAQRDLTAADDAGAMFVIWGPVTAGRSLEQADVSLWGEGEDDRAGDWLGTGGDLDGDGVDDLVIAARWAEAVGYKGGSVYALLGPVLEDRSLSAADAIWRATEHGDEAGTALAGPSDADGDGFADFLVGADDSDLGGGHSGAAYLVRGPTSGEHDLSEADTILVGEKSNDHAGCAVELEDLDGDGLQDAIVGAWGQDTGFDLAGAVYVVLAPPTGVVDLSEADNRILGDGYEHYAGGQVVALDWNGDGHGDLAIGANGWDGYEEDSGAVLVSLGPWAEQSGLDDAEVVYVGNGAGHRIGGELASAGDIDGDDRPDLLVGDSKGLDWPDEVGQVYLLRGGPTGQLALKDADLILQGAAHDDYVGRAMSGGFDGDGDGVPDLWIGAAGVDDGDRDAGAAYLLSGSDL